VVNNVASHASKEKLINTKSVIYVLWNNYSKDIYQKKNYWWI